MIEKLERQYALRMLLLIHKRGPFKSLKDLVNALGVRSFVGPTRALEVLADLGLVKMSSHEGFPFRVRIELTELGQKVAEHLALIEELLSMKCEDRDKKIKEI